MWNLTYDTDEFIYETEIHRHRKQTHGFQQGGIGWEFGISRCKLLYIGWINNKVLHGELHPISCDKHNGKEYEKNVHICVYKY